MSCVACPAGTRRSPGANFCAVCPRGQRLLPSGACEPCPAGQFVAGGVECRSCGIGQRPNTTLTGCAACPADAVVDLRAFDGCAASVQVFEPTTGALLRSVSAAGQVRSTTCAPGQPICIDLCGSTGGICRYSGATASFPAPSPASARVLLSGGATPSFLFTATPAARFTAGTCTTPPPIPR